MKPVRLFILGALATGGPTYGYQIRQNALRDQTEWWTDVKPGSLYNALHRMADEGLVEVDRTETPDNSPQRTIYRITSAGRQALVVQRDEALQRVVVATDPLDLALRYVSDLPTDTLVEIITARHTALLQRLWLHEQAYASARPYLEGLDTITFRHVLNRLRTEVQWHEQLLAELAATRGPAGPASADAAVPAGNPPA